MLVMLIVVIFKMIYVFQIDTGFDDEQTKDTVHVEMLVGSDIEGQILSILNKEIDKRPKDLINWLYVDMWLDGKLQKQLLYELDSLGNIRKVS